MDVTAVLDEFRQKAQGCDLAAFTDLGTGMILCASSGVRRPQEELDALSESAAAVLSETMADSVSPVIDADDPLSAITVTAFEARVYLRTPALPSEALICICAPGADLAGVVEHGRATLERIAAAHGGAS
jgi:hypothetical protein